MWPRAHRRVARLERSWPACARRRSAAASSALPARRRSSSCTITSSTRAYGQNEGMTCNISTHVSLRSLPHPDNRRADSSALQESAVMQT